MSESGMRPSGWFVAAFTALLILGVLSLMALRYATARLPQPSPADSETVPVQGNP